MDKDSNCCGNLLKGATQDNTATNSTGGYMAKVDAAIEKRVGKPNTSPDSMKDHSSFKQPWENRE
jgi:hypothetical protein